MTAVCCKCRRTMYVESLVDDGKGERRCNQHFETSCAKLAAQRPRSNARSPKSEKPKH